MSLDRGIKEALESLAVISKEIEVNLYFQIWVYGGL